MLVRVRIVNSSMDCMCTCFGTMLDDSARLVAWRGDKLWPVGSIATVCDLKTDRSGHLPGAPGCETRAEVNLGPCVGFGPGESQMSAGPDK